MSFPDPRRSIDTAPSSPSSQASTNQPSFSRYESSPRLASSRPIHSRRSETSGSISFGGAIDIRPQRTASIAESNSNAISTLLMPPIVRTGLIPHTAGSSGHKAPSTKDIPPVTLTNLPRIDPNAFKPYLSQAGTLYEALRRAKDGTDDGRPQSAGRSSRDALPSEEGSNRRSARSTSTSSADILTSGLGLHPSEGQMRRRGSGGVSRRAGPTVAPLSTIPNVYFDDDFHLENPRIFDTVSEKAEIVRQPGLNGSTIAPGSSGKKALATNAILQEKLSWYMDTVEIHLISSISSASTSFFAALGSLRQLHAEAVESVEKIQSLRADLAKLDKNMAQGGLKIVAMKKKRENVRKLGDAVHQLQRIVEAVTTCEDQVDRGEVEIALKGLAGVERLIAGDPQDPEAEALGQKPLPYNGELIDLRGLRALEGAGNDIASLRKTIGKALEAKFIDTMLSDLRNHVGNVPSSDTFQRWEKASNRLRGQHIRTPSAFPAFMNIDGTFRSALHAQLKGLARSDAIMVAATTYRDVILREFKNLIRRQLPSSSDDDVESTTSIATQESRGMSRQERSSILARNLRALEAEDAEEMFKKIYSNVGEGLRRLGMQVKVLLDITSSLGNPHPLLPMRSPRTPMTASIDGYMNAEPSPGPPPAMVHQEEIQQALDLSSLLGQAVDIAQAQITKVLRARVDQTTKLSVNRFLRYFTLNRLFADECEAVSGRGGSALKSVVNDHIKAFVANIGEAERRRLVQTMDADRWDAKDLSDVDAKRLDLLMEASTHDIESWTRASFIWETAEVEEAGKEPNGVIINGSTADGVISHVSTPSRTATIDEQSFILPEAALAVSSGIEIFERLLTGIPSMSHEIINVLLDYLRLFNSRTHQLILGAGAMRSAGLKNITTKHLALSSQSLSFVIALVPYLREFARRQNPSAAPGNSNLADFDKVKRQLQEHQAGIHEKLVDIMSGRAAVHIAVMRRIDWDAAAATKTAENDAIGGYMETLVRETATLHKVLSKHLPATTVQTILTPILQNYRQQWGQAYAEAVLQTPAGQAKMLRDVEFFRSRVAKLDGANDVGAWLVGVVAAKEVVAATAAAAAAAAAAAPVMREA